MADPLSLANALSGNVSLMPPARPQTFGVAGPTNGFNYNSAMPIFRQLIARGHSPMDAAAVTGNWAHESGPRGTLDPAVVEQNRPSNRTGHGAGQWTGARWNGENGLQNWSQQNGRDWRDPQTQLDFYEAERGMNNQAAQGVNRMFDTPDLRGKVDQFMMNWENPAAPKGVQKQVGNPETYLGREKRFEHAQNILNQAQNYGPPMPGVGGGIFAGME